MSRRSLRNLIIEACAFIIPLLTTISPSLVYRAQRQEEITRLVVPFLLLLVALHIPTHDELLLLMQRLNPSFRGYNFRGRNVFEDAENQRHLFLLFIFIAFANNAGYSTISRRRRGDYKPIFTEPKAK